MAAPALSQDTIMVPQSRKDCVHQPRVARNELPWVAGGGVSNPNGVASCSHGPAATPLGLSPVGAISQGSSRLATLGLGPESRWDSTLEFPKSIDPNGKFDL